MLDRK